jgi:hypothetical protein
MGPSKPGADSFGRIVDHHGGNAGVRRMNCAEQFRVMAFAQLTWRESLRDIEVTLAANSHKRYAIGLRNEIRRSTLAEASESRDWHIWSDFAALLIRRARKLYSECDLGLDLKNTVYALDSTTIDLCLSLFEWASFRSTKAAVKMHTLLDLRGNIPTFIHVSDGKMGDVNVLDVMPVEAGAFYVMDRGYLDFSRLYTMHQAGAFFVTRAKSGMDARRVYSAPNDRSSGVICDQRIALNGFYPSKGYPDHLRRIRFNDQQLDKTLVFLTNNTVLPPLTIAALYKSRWQVELFFKWIKQHLRIKKFLGTSENAVKTQIWCAVSTYVLIAIIKKVLKLESSLYNILQILSISVFEKTLISQALQPESLDENLHAEQKQLILFDF